MLVFPQWRSDMANMAMATEGCKIQRWMPAEHFAPYFARPAVLPPLPQTEDEDSSGGSSPERSESVEGEVLECGWRGCCAQFNNVVRLSAHVARLHAHAHRDGLFYCGWTGCARPQKGFNARYKMLVHVRTHTNERPHTCNQCNKSFSRAENLKIHLRSHSGEKPYVCPYEGCGKAYSNSSDRFKHTRTHTVDKPYCCKVSGCNKRYTDPSSLRKHVKTYKHFVTDDKKDSSDEQCQLFSPTDNYSQRVSPLREEKHCHPLSPANNYSQRLSPSRDQKHCQPVPPADTYSQRFSPLREQKYNIEIVSPPQQPTMSPLIPPYNPILPLTEQSMTYNLDRPYMHLDPYLRVPSYEMTYMEYRQMYENAYRNSYANSISYPVRPTVIEKAYTYEEPRLEHLAMEEVESCETQESEEAPLNLICPKKIECRPFEELVKRTDMPLDLSTKS